MSIRQTCVACGWATKPGTRAQTDHWVRRHHCAKVPAATFPVVDRTPQPCRHNGIHHLHGTNDCYGQDNCRCYPCAAANREHEREIARSLPVFVDPAAARTHLQHLVGVGIRPGLITHISGITIDTIRTILSEAGTSRIRRSTAARILALPIPDLNHLPATQTIPAAGSTRRLQALATLGWSNHTLAAHTRLKPAQLDLVRTGTATITVEAARAIRDLYERLWATSAPVTGTSNQKATAAARAEASRNNWAPPMAWDDDTIDQPDAKDQRGRHARRSPADLRDAFRQAQLVTDDLAVIADRLGYSSFKNLERVLLRNGLADLTHRTRRSA